MTTKKKVEPVDEVGSIEHPYAETEVTPEESAEIEDRGPDQITDYHKTHPTLKVELPTEKE